VAEPSVKRVVAFIDGQNLFHSVKWEFGYKTPNYDVSKLATAVGSSRVSSGWSAPSVRFYTGTPSAQADPTWSSFWQRKTAAMRSAGVTVFTRTLRYREQRFTCASCRLEQPITCSACRTAASDKGQEKGIDVRLALDIVSGAVANDYDAALIFSQDQDLSEAVDEVKLIARQSGRWIRLASAFPQTTRNRRGIQKTDWITFDKATYDACIDPKNYRI
jgi:uncharacterized LabA/DUF88 family protein